MKVLVTGASGFIGTHLCMYLAASGWYVRGTSRRAPLSKTESKNLEWYLTDELGPETDWRSALTGVDAVVHLASRVHVLHEKASDSLNVYRHMNVVATENLARQAVECGVRRLVFLSTVKVNGEGNSASYTEADVPAPLDPYGVSKCEAEESLRTISAETGLEVVILRPPLVYGPGVRANFLRFLKLIESGLPLPFASIENRRSFIYVENLVDAVSACLTCDAAINRTYLVSDGDDISTPELIHILAALMGKRVLQFPVPTGLLAIIGKVTGTSSYLARIVGNLTVNTQQIRKDLSWIPPFTLEEGLRKTVCWYKSKEFGS